MASKTSHFIHLKNKWSKKHKEIQSKLWEKHGNALKWVGNTFSKEQLAAGSLGGIMLLSAPHNLSLPTPQNIFAKEKFAQEIDKSSQLMLDLLGKLPSDVRPLSEDEEKTITEILSKDLRITITAILEGKRLSRSYGYIGAEQHLARYPGDSINTHFDTEEDVKHFYSSGMAPGLGAWGYFTQSKNSMTEKDKLREKYYIAVQTFVSKDFLNRVAEYRDFFKYRKMVVVNPNNGRAIVVVIGDAGPSQWTGKHLGGSPEVMQYLERLDGSQKGVVLYFFIDDPKDEIPLGPISL